MKAVLVLLSLMVAVSGILPVFAETNEVPLDWKIRFWWNDNITQRFASSSSESVKVLTDHVAELQKEIQKRAINSDPIPNDFEKRRTELLEKAETVLNTVKTNMPINAQERSDVSIKLTNAFEQKISELKKLGEYNQILKYVNDFQRLRDMQDPEIKRQFATELDAKVNKLESVINGCEKRIDSLALSEASNPYLELQTNYCQKSLNGIELNQIRAKYNI